MATYVGNTGTTHHYADYRIALFWYVGQHIEVRLYSRGKPHVTVTEIGRVRSRDHAVDKVAAIIRRKRELSDLLTGDTP